MAVFTPQLSGSSHVLYFELPKFECKKEFASPRSLGLSQVLSMLLLSYLLLGSERASPEERKEKKVKFALVKKKSKKKKMFC